jgi:hypothetical protein
MILDKKKDQELAFFTLRFLKAVANFAADVYCRKCGAQYPGIGPTVTATTRGLYLSISMSRYWFRRSALQVTR